MLFPRKIVLTLLLHYFITFSLFSQEIKKGEVYQYARKIVDTMTSESMHGRGYVNDGDEIAANYIRSEFMKFGVKKFNNSYYQKLRFSVNTFPEDVVLTMDNFPETWVEGKNYLVGASSPSIEKQNYEVIWFDSAVVSSPENLKNFSKIKFNKKWILVDEHGVTDKEKLKLFDFMKTNPYKAFGIAIVNDSKLTWECSQTVDKFPVLELLINDSLRSKMNRNKKFNINFELKNKFIPDHQSQNVIAYVEGSVRPDSFIVFSAHYDHLGQMGKVYFPGANDNASGCAMLLNLAKYYSMPEHRPKYSVAFMAFCGEEAGLLGSKYYTEHPLFPLNNIRFLLNMDIMGTGEDGITVVNGTLFKTEFDKLKEINTQNNFIKDVKIRGKAANSDHYFFAENGVRACFIYTMGGIKAYHDIYDKAETLPLNEFENLFKLITKFGDYLQNELIF
jgi:aminopeptidase YwaD